jgi:hypothetical protein
MLAAMTYSTELFAAVLLGLTGGYALFNMAAPPPASPEPCCVDTDADSQWSSAEGGGRGGEEYELLGRLANAASSARVHAPGGRKKNQEYQKLV